MCYHGRQQTFELNINRGIGIGNSSGGTATGFIDVVANQVFTVGTQQRDAKNLFLRAVNMVQKGLQHSRTVVLPK